MKPSNHGFTIEFIHADPHPIRNTVNWYRWEFLRRNLEYQADYKKFIDKFGEWLHQKGYWFDRRRRALWTRADERYFHKKIFPTIGALCEKWQVHNLFSPTWSFDRRTGLHRFPGGTVEIPTIIAPGWNWDRSLLKNLIKLGFVGTADLAKRHGNLVLAEFDLNWPMKDLLDYAKRVLSYANENYTKELRRHGLTVPTSRRRLQDYDTHLKVFDLKRLGKSPKEIAHLVFPLDSSITASQKVHDHLKAANRLVTGHPQEIR
jgi:hypothetical protein